MRITAVALENLNVYLNLAQCYEAEFSRITHKKPNADGLYALDTHLGDHVTGLILMIDETPAGIAAIAAKNDGSYEMCEFYVIPSFRKNSLGTAFAHLIWKTYAGNWEIKQIAGAEYATTFWRKAITEFGQTEYEEDRYEDSYWGVVTRQRFRIEQHN